MKESVKVCHNIGAPNEVTEEYFNRQLEILTYNNDTEALTDLLSKKIAWDTWCLLLNNRGAKS